MSEIEVRCQNCGATLSVDQACHYATCAACHASLEIVQGQSAVFTRVTIATPFPGPTVESLLREKELMLLDREWAGFWRWVMVDGRRREALWEPNLKLAWLRPFPLFVVGFGILNQDEAHRDPIIGISVLAFAVALFIYEIRKARSFQEARRKYLKRRERLTGSAEMPRIPY